jgi:cleavage and polyadenylation specificity factor subunit 2
MFMYDAYQSRANCEDFTLFDLDDVDACFERFKQLKYSQHFVLGGIEGDIWPQILTTLTGKGAGIEITPYAAGHTIGGTVWKICKETEEIVYQM